MSEHTPPSPATPAAAPAGRTADEIRRDPLVASAVSRADEAILDAREFAGEITLFVDRDRIVEVCRAFKDDGFVYLVDLAGVDYSKYPGHTGLRFSVAYTLYSFRRNARVRLRVWTDEKGPIPSVTSVWKTANWHERETFDMFGIQFSGHPNLERILMWEGFNGHPLRKDFPIRGIDTGARIYPEVFPEGGGPKPGSTGKDAKDVNLYKGDWKRYGTWPAAQIGGGNGAKAPAPPPAPAKPAAAVAAPKPEEPEE
jgi:NADH-quinone oxidoreductase subunit C